MQLFTHVTIQFRFYLSRYDSMIQTTKKALCISFIFPLIAALSLVLIADRSEAEDITGTITETMDGAGYTYMLIDTGKEKMWVAIPETEVTAGKKISVKEGMEMKNFHSNSFDRTFDSIIFSPGLAGAKPASPHGKSKKPEPAQNDSFAAAVEAERGTSSGPQPVEPVQGSAGSQGAIAPFAESEVEKAVGENAYTVGEIFEQAKALNGKKVRIRGQVVKFNANIMGKNWLHLQDGTGDPMQNTHDLVATTSEPVNSPSVITVEGTVAADKDFGAGYKYVVIIENSTIIE